MRNRCPRRLSKRPSEYSRLALVALVLMFPTASLAGTSPIVFHSPQDDGTRPTGTPVLAAGSSFTVHLYMDEGDGSDLPSITDPCESGDGQERCGWDLVVDGLGDVDFLGFVPSGDVIAGLTPAPTPRLLFNGGVVDVGELGPVKLGDLQVSTNGTGSVEMTGGTVIDARLLKVVLVPATLVTVPEPALAGLLLAGLAWLVGLVHLSHRIRSGSNRLHGRAQIYGLLVGTLALVSASPGAAQSLCDPGDLNDDGAVDILDSTVLRRDLAGLGPGISSSCEPPDAYEQCRTGRSVGFLGTGNTCNFTGSPNAPALPAIALTEKNYAELFTVTGYDAPFPGQSRAKACGACIEVFGPNGSAVGVVREVADIAAVGDFGKPNTPHLAPALTAAIGVSNGVSGGLSFRVVPCPLTGSLQVRRHSFSSTAFPSFTVYNHTDAIEGVELQEDQPNQPWLPMEQSWTNRWEIETGVYPFLSPDTTVRLRVTSLLGDMVVTDPVPLPSFSSTSEAFFDAGVQLPGRLPPAGTCSYVATCGDGYIDLAALEECEPLTSEKLCTDLGFGNAASVPCDPETCRDLPWECTP